MKNSKQQATNIPVALNMPNYPIDTADHSLPTDLENPPPDHHDLNISTALGYFGSVLDEEDQNDQPVPKADGSVTQALMPFFGMFPLSQI